MEFIDTYRIVTFVPDEKMIPIIRDNICAIDPLDVGAYKNVTWTSASGIEHFKQKSNSIHFTSEETSEYDHQSYRLEFTIKRDKKLLEKIILSIKEKHPWEEPVIQIYETLETRFSEQ